MASRSKMKRLFTLFDQDVKEESNRLFEKESARLGEAYANKEKESEKQNNSYLQKMQDVIDDQDKTITDLVKQLAEAKQALAYYDEPEPDEINEIDWEGGTDADKRDHERTQENSELPY